MILPVILAGGSGTRLWPLSRSLFPKQFLKLHGEQTMFQDTLNRLLNIEAQKPLVICNNEHRFLVAEQLRNISCNAEILLEPIGRNTAPAICLAALKMLNQNEDPLLLILAADHLIEATEKFEKAIQDASMLANQNKMVTFGIIPRQPETGYGYIQRGAAIDEQGYLVSKFVEKPNIEVAQQYVDSGEYYWNSGMFMFKASVFINELKKHYPEIVEVCERSMSNVTTDLDFLRIDEDIFAQCPAQSIDYALMEHTDKAAVVALDAGWNDIGSWSAIWDVRNKDAHGNSLRGDIICCDSSNCLIQGEERLISVLGLDDIVVIDTKDALLVAHKNTVQDVKKIVEELKIDNRYETINHREVYRPWGKYDSVDVGNRYQVKRITVKPGAKLSVQMHHHRAEHWIVVTGIAKVTNGEKTFLLTENESTYIPIGQVHALENPGKLPLELIEVQTGSYLMEDDIVRFADDYGRS